MSAGDATDRRAVRERLLTLTAADRQGRSIGLLEQEWARHKYAVLERSQHAYDAIRALLRDKGGFPVEAFYALLDEAYATSPTTGQRINAAEHVWGYFKRRATATEREAFQRLVSGLLAGTVPAVDVKAFLKRLMDTYGAPSLGASLYFENE